ncbi:MAG: class I tRNA ligase family protein, partial [Armatimonadota bacterium]
GENLLVWTTTPWTLAANVACAVHPALQYVKVRHNGRAYWLSAGRVEALGLSDALTDDDPVPGTELVGLGYDGPFDELPAQAEARERHTVVAWDMVSDEEGTGIVHIAPGCGREDFELSQEMNLPVIAPIDESGVYEDGYDFLTGKRAQDVAPLVFDSLREKGLLFAILPYTHNYPHCWRCGTALLFRNVGEWFIDMSWRDEIKRVARQIRWIPEWGLDQELDWLDNMRDWMISKKRYWGLALPIWECPDCGTFDVIGSKEELRERAVEGWEQFDGHSPHRPWVDCVKIACPNCGAKTSRIPDVGNPWLDAGIVPYSTVRYNTDRDYWSKWIPADLVLECFPGQFRNWFYALLAMSTMMENIPPFKTLVGHALVRDERGDEMHKSKGNAIEFNEAAEKMGVDVMRWMFCQQNPVANLNFGYSAGQSIRRTVFNTLWNTYAFFCNYARLDEFDPRREPVPLDQRTDMDRWILSNLNILVRTAREAYADFSVHTFVRCAEDFIEALSNWYVRRNRRRFWRAKDLADLDKLAA